MLCAAVLQATPERFRPNMLLEGLAEPYAEDAWRTLRIGDCAFSVTVTLSLRLHAASPLPCGPSDCVLITAACLSALVSLQHAPDGVLAAALLSHTMLPPIFCFLP
jgi:hypothetical protein